ncbi:hypothetical protein EV678_1382 [Azospira oryzae]|uniref:Uncharacterized protein n=1 Tax=Azospira oryzae TaxID=146939 RepID=A0ABY0ISL5_9RHOO|nr:hypothetical protein [Azospira oryzae]RZT90564.1 hypothetical protein EV678_1382 [Azospira oryzae]
MVVGKKSFAEWARASEAPDPSLAAVAAPASSRPAPALKRPARRRGVPAPPPRRGWLLPLLLGVWLGKTLGDD